MTQDQFEYLADRLADSLHALGFVRMMVDQSLAGVEKERTLSELKRIHNEVREVIVRFRGMAALEEAKDLPFLN